MEDDVEDNPGGGSNGLLTFPDYDPRRGFPYGLSPIPEVPSELASEISESSSESNTLQMEESTLHLLSSEEDEEEEEEEEEGGSIRSYASDSLAISSSLDDSLSSPESLLKAEMEGVLRKIQELGRRLPPQENTSFCGSIHSTSGQHSSGGQSLRNDNSSSPLGVFLRLLGAIEGSGPPPKSPPPLPTLRPPLSPCSSSAADSSLSDFEDILEDLSQRAIHLQRDLSPRFPSQATRPPTRAGGIHQPLRHSRLFRLITDDSLSSSQEEDLSFSSNSSTSSNTNGQTTSSEEDEAGLRSSIQLQMELEELENLPPSVELFSLEPLPT